MLWAHNKFFRGRTEINEPYEVRGSGIKVKLVSLSFIVSISKSKMSEKNLRNRLLKNDTPKSSIL